MKYLRYAALFLFVFAASAYAGEWQYSGHAKLLLNHAQYQADDRTAVLAGQNDLTDINTNLRFNLQGQWQSWDLNIHYQLAGMSGDSTGLLVANNPLGGASTAIDEGNLFYLSSVISDDGYHRWLHRLDRLNVGYSADDWIIRFGRQAISWGNGINFNPLDIFNPFSPLSLDTEYKNGDDLFYMQWMLSNQTDLQLIYLPRRDTDSGELSNSLDSLALKMHIMSQSGDWDLLVASHYDDTVYGLTYVRNVSGAVWRNDINLTRLANGRDTWFVDSNMDYSWSAFGRNFYGYIEWFHNSLGQSIVDISSVDPALMERITRGELYSLVNNIFSIGMMMEMNPRWNANLSMLYAPGDKGHFANLRFNYDWKQNASMIMGISLPGGARGSEYGGVYYPDGADSGYVGAATQVYFYMQYYY